MRALMLSFVLLGITYTQHGEIARFYEPYALQPWTFIQVQYLPEAIENLERTGGENSDQYLAYVYAWNLWKSRATCGGGDE